MNLPVSKPATRALRHYWPPNSDFGFRPSFGLRVSAFGFLARFGFRVSALLCLFLTAGCTAPRPLRGGHSTTIHQPAGTIDQTLNQGQNPSAASRQDQETVRVRTYTLPAGSRIEQNSVPNTPLLQHSNTPSACLVLSAPMPVTEREETRAKTELGAAQKDTARELAAKLSSLKAIVWVGLGLFIFGLASLVWPPLKAIIGSVTTSAAIILGGLALMILPTLIVGNELLILGGVALVVSAWFLAHRHGHLRGQLSAPLNLNPNRNLPLSRQSTTKPDSPPPLASTSVH